MLKRKKKLVSLSAIKQSTIKRGLLSYQGLKVKAYHASTASHSDTPRLHPQNLPEPGNRMSLAAVAGQHHSRHFKPSQLPIFTLGMLLLLLTVRQMLIAS